MKRSRGIVALALAGSFGLLAAGCGASSAAPTAWATVNGHAITKAQVETRIGVIKVLSPQAATQLKQRSAYVSVAQDLASEYLVLQEAHGAKFTLSKQQVSTADGQMASYLLSNYGSTSALDKAIKAAGVTMANLDAYAAEAALLQGYLQKVVKPAQVSTQQVAAFYAANRSQFQQPEEYDLRHILVASRSLAENILQQLQKGASFAALAKKYSTDTGSAAKGGDLGYAPLTTYVTPFADAAKQLTKVGQLSGIVHSQFGYHIIQLLGIKPATTQSLSQVSAQIRSYLQQKNLQQSEQTYVAALTAKAKIKTMIPKQVP